MKKTVILLAGLLFCLTVIGGCGKQDPGPEVVIQGPDGRPAACVIDLDGTVADERLRRSRAEDADGKIDWQTYFDPKLVDLDTPMPGALAVMKQIESLGVKIIYLSSRPQSMYDASRIWLEKHGFPQGQIYHKQERYEKTVQYKSRVMKELAGKFYIWFAVGDRPSDAEAYNKAGVKFFMISEKDPEGSWEEVKKFIDKTVGG